MDPTFEKEKFVHMCRDEFIPNILEVILWLVGIMLSVDWSIYSLLNADWLMVVMYLQALVRGELEILKDWCYEAVGLEYAWLWSCVLL